MPNYKKLYFDLFAATDKAIKTLINAQQKAEEDFLSSETLTPINFYEVTKKEPPKQD